MGAANEDGPSGVGSTVGKVAISTLLTVTGVGHLTFLREAFQAQVPKWFPGDPDKLVIGSGIAEIALGVAGFASWKQPARARVGAAQAAFFVAIFPGNIAQYREHKGGPPLDTDQRRFWRLFLQIPLVALSLIGGKTAEAQRRR